jgi:hypothetical protein
MQRITRREIMLVTGLAAAACAAGTLGVGGLLLLRRRAAPTPTPLPSATLIVPPQPIIVSRKAWGARDPDHTAPNEYGYADSPLENGWRVYPGELSEVYNTVVIHHTAHAHDTVETMQDIQNLHMNRNGWADIGYHYGIDPNGNIYEGRDIGVRGSSVSGYNTGLIGVVLMGNFEVDQPTEAQIASAQALVDWLAALYRLSHLAGHSEFNGNTVCPGENLNTQLDIFASHASLRRGIDGYVAPSLG